MQGVSRDSLATDFPHRSSHADLMLCSLRQCLHGLRTEVAVSLGRSRGAGALQMQSIAGSSVVAISYKQSRLGVDEYGSDMRLVNFI